MALPLEPTTASQLEESANAVDQDDGGEFMPVMVRRLFRCR
ncbi:hypothetical protein OG585_42560 [Streptomyces sp. NBC_01340]|nr:MULTISPECIES: hypothetical protein [unclassified Streptomyces]MCX4459421.1 hypothetical protein [Streptomyces sp. NBC_01719]MCX4595317.1 hypothetical protein [Streptomyces sp. NBC_01549]WSI43244.1 hypothetical protein OG585_42560 [Streptomyces sp. NBC_01340]